MSTTGTAMPAAAPPGRVQAAYGLAASEAGSLKDADLAMELAQLTALQNRQRPGGDSPAPVNPTPLTLLSLFSHA